MGRRALDVDAYSLSASIVFERLRVERELSQREMMKGVGMTAVSRFKGLMEGNTPWNLGDIEKFANFLGIPIKTAISRIVKESLVG